MSEDTGTNPEGTEGDGEDVERTPEEQAEWKRQQQARRDEKHPHGGPPGQAKKTTGGSEPAGEV